MPAYMARGKVRHSKKQILSMVLFDITSVLQMSMVEAEDAGNGTPQGVVLAIVGPSHDPPVINKDYENIRTVRMYNLASLINLARWTISHGVNKSLNVFYILSLNISSGCTADRFA